MKALKWIILLIAIGVLISLIDTPFMRNIFKTVIGWAVILLAIVGVFTLLDKR